MTNNNITVKDYQPDKDGIDRWNHYLENNDNSCFYQRIEWQLINSEYFNHKVINLAAEKMGRIIGVLPLVSLKSILFGHIVCSMPFVNYGSSCTDSDEIEILLTERACQLTKEADAKYLEIRSQRPSVTKMRESTNKVSLTIKLDKDYEILWNGFKSKHRTNIRRVYKSGITIRKGGEELLSDFYHILSKSWRDLGTPIYSYEYFRRIFKYFKNDITIFVAYKDDMPVASALNGYYKKNVEGMWLGTDSLFRKYQPSYVLYWEMIKDACERGYTTYHLGRSSVDSGGESFKKKWNADTKQLYWQYYLNKSSELPNLNPTNPKYQVAIKMWRKMPLRMTQIIGPLVSKYIP